MRDSGLMTSGVVPIWQKNHAIGIKPLGIEGGDVSDNLFILKINDRDGSVA